MFNYYNNTVQNLILPKLDIDSNIHIADTTLATVYYWNKNYQDSQIVKGKKTGKLVRAYKLGTMRSIVDDFGLITEARLGLAKQNDAKFFEEMLINSPVLKPGDILIIDRGFISRKILNYLKTVRQVDVYIPLRKKMDAYNEAIRIVCEENKWFDHPNRKRKHQKIAFVENLGAYWVGRKPKENVDFNACVVWDTSDGEYYVFITTDLSKSAKQIIKTYELRSEIEEDYRQLKDGWKLEDFKSTQRHIIDFHIVSTLFAYLFYQLFIMSQEGEKYQHKSLPSILKNYNYEIRSFILLYCGNQFGIFSLMEYGKIYASCNNDIQNKIDEVLIKFNPG